MSEKLDKTTAVASLQQLALKLGKSPTRNEFCTQVPGGRKALVEFYGDNFSNLQQDAGVATYRLKNITQAKSDLIVNNPIQFPQLPDDDIPVEEIINSMCRRFDKRKTAHEAKKWMEYKINTDLPIGINWFGDPHLDDDGCNWPLLMKHIQILKTTPGMFAANIGDTHNNWVGRLVKEYANQNTSRNTAWKLINWFFNEAGINWLLILLGNHDSWNFGNETMANVVNKVPMVDWRAQIKLKFQNDIEILIDAAHDHAGHSQWNSLHAQQKASTMGGIAHFYIAGHRHIWAIAQNECPHTGRVSNLARARGYKQIDHYGESLGFGSHKYGASIVQIIDPRAPEINRIKVFADPEEGAAYLTYLRNKYEALDKT